MDYVPLPVFDPPAQVAKADPSLLAVFGPTKQKKVTEEFKVAGWHRHVCPNGHSWEHGSASFGNVAAHTCPQCGLQDWTPRPVAYSLPASASNCPGGVCPTPSQSAIILPRLFRR